MKLARERTVAAALATLVVSPVAGEGIPAAGRMGGVAVATRVDSEIAHLLLAADGGEWPRAGLSAAARRALELADEQPLDWRLLDRLSDDLSLDAATVYFANRLVAEPMNRALRERFDQALATLRAAPETLGVEAPAGALIVLVPGLGWRSNPGTGADFHRQRALLARLGVAYRLVETREYGRIEENAALVAEALEELARDHEHLFLVSASIGGAVTAHALARTPPEPLARVRAWLSAGGLLRGSPWADRWSTGLRGALGRGLLAFRGLPARTAAELATDELRPRMERFTLPPGMRAIAWIGAPLSGQIGEAVRERWRYIRRFGPNDGLTLLADELIPGGRALVTPGLDHYFRDPEIDLKTAALTRILFEDEREAGTDAGRDGAETPLKVRSAGASSW